MTDRLKAFHLSQDIGDVAFFEIDQTKCSHVHAVVFEIFKIEGFDILQAKKIKSKYTIVTTLSSVVNPIIFYYNVTEK